MLTSPKSAVSSTLYSNVTLTFDLLIPNCATYITVPSCIIDVRLVKMCQISARYHVNNVSGCTHGHMDACADKQDKNSMLPATPHWAEAKKTESSNRSSSSNIGSAWNKQVFSTQRTISSTSWPCEGQTLVVRSQHDAQRYCHAMQTTAISWSHRVEPSELHQQRIWTFNSI